MIPNLVRRVEQLVGGLAPLAAGFTGEQQRHHVAAFSMSDLRACWLYLADLRHAGAVQIDHYHRFARRQQFDRLGPVVCRGPGGLHHELGRLRWCFIRPGPVAPLACWRDPQRGDLHDLADLKLLDILSAPGLLSARGPAAVPFRLTCRCRRRGYRGRRRGGR